MSCRYANYVVGRLVSIYSFFYQSSPGPYRSFVSPTYFLDYRYLSTTFCISLLSSILLPTLLLRKVQHTNKNTTTLRHNHNHAHRPRRTSRQRRRWALSYSSLTNQQTDHLSPTRPPPPRRRPCRPRPENSPPSHRGPRYQPSRSASR